MAAVRRHHRRGEVRALVLPVARAAHAIRALFLARFDLMVANLAVRHWVLELKRTRPRPVLEEADRR